MFGIMKKEYFKFGISDCAERSEIVKKKAIPVGYEDFKEIIDKNFYYIDKTHMIKELLDQTDKVSLFTRPRRSGKKLNLSMIRRFFEIEMDFDGQIQDNSYLFENLFIGAAGDEYTQHMGKYPVINLSLKSAKQASFDMSYEALKYEIEKEFDRHQYVLMGIVLALHRKKFLQCFRFMDWKKNVQKFKSGMTAMFLEK